jgi:predicted ATPase
MTSGFARLAVRGYRRLSYVILPLGRLNVLIGANGVGKTSVLDVFDLLAASAKGHLESAVIARSL